MDEKTIEIQIELAEELSRYLRVIYPMMNNLAKSDISGYYNRLQIAMGKKPKRRWSK